MNKNELIKLICNKIETKFDKMLNFISDEDIFYEIKNAIENYKIELLNEIKEI